MGSSTTSADTWLYGRLRFGAGNSAQNIYEDATGGYLYLATNGYAQARLSSLGWEIPTNGTGTFGTGGALIQNDAGSATYPTYSFQGDTDTGMYHGTADQIILGTGGTARVYISTTQFVVPLVYSDTTASAANVYVASNGRMQRSTSARKYKTNVVYDRDVLAGYDLHPVSFESKIDGSTHYGLIADDLALQNKDFATYGDDGQVEDYDTRAVIAVLAAKVNRLENERAT